MVTPKNPELTPTKTGMVANVTATYANTQLSKFDADQAKLGVTENLPLPPIQKP